jgi:crossover junction endodeoxyribonuclease RuvC
MIKQKMILALDPGSIKFGYALCLNVGRSLEIIEQGTVHLNRADGTQREITIHTRLARAHKKIEELCRQYNVAECAIEEAFVGKNINSAITLSMARGVLMAPLLARDIPIFEYPTKTAKKLALGNAAASKDEGIKLMQLEFAHSGVVDDLTEDAADALIVCKAHVEHSFFTNMVDPGAKSQIQYRNKTASSLTKNTRISSGKRSGAGGRTAMEEHLRASGRIR